MKEYRIKVTVRNNLLLLAIEKAGYKSQSDFVKELNVSLNQLNALIAMRTCPITNEGNFTD